MVLVRHLGRGRGIVEGGGPGGSGSSVPNKVSTTARWPLGDTSRHTSRAAAALDATMLYATLASLSG